MLTNSSRQYSCLVPVYCFMPDHLHLMLQGENSKADLWRTVVDFKQTSGFWLAQRLKKAAWQKGFYDHLIRNNKDAVSQVRYILDNPCRKGLVQEWEQYPFKGALGCRLEDVLGGIG